MIMNTALQIKNVTEVTFHVGLVFYSTVSFSAVFNNNKTIL